MRDSTSEHTWEELLTSKCYISVLVALYILPKKVLDFYLKWFVQEILKFFWKIIPRTDLRSSVGGDQEKGSKWCLLQIGRLAVHHLDSHDAQRPNVDLFTCKNNNSFLTTEKCGPMKCLKSCPLTLDFTGYPKIKVDWGLNENKIRTLAL